MNDSDRGPQPADERPQLNAPNSEVRGYTFALGLLGLLLFYAASMFYSLADAPSTSSESRWAFTLVARGDIFLGVVACLVAVLRARRSRYAYMATAAMSWFLLVCIPVGTAFWAYWFFGVRPRECPPNSPLHPSSGRASAGRVR